MRKLMVVLAALGALAWSGAVLAVEGGDVPVTENGKALNEGTLVIKDSASGHVIASGPVKNGTAHLTYHGRKPDPGTKVVTQTHSKDTGKTYVSTDRDKTLGALLAGGLDAATGAAAFAGGFAVLSHTMPMSQGVSPSSWWWELGVNAVSTSDDNTGHFFGAGTGGGVYLHDDKWSWSAGFHGGVFAPIGGSWAAGLEANILTAPNSHTINGITPNGIPVSSAVQQKGAAYQFLGRLTWNAAEMLPFLSNDARVSVGAGVETGRLGTTILAPTVGDTFISDGSYTAPVFSVALQNGICPLFNIPFVGGMCPVALSSEIQVVPVNKTFFAGINGPSEGEGHVGTIFRTETGIVVRFPPALAFPFVPSTAQIPVPVTASDIRLKRDIVAVGRLDNGLGLYRFRYLWNDQIYVGVMAQEVAQVVPDAVIQGSDGYLRVNYARLGLKMQTWDEWRATHSEVQRTD